MKAVIVAMAAAGLLLGGCSGKGGDKDAAPSNDAASANVVNATNAPANAAAVTGADNAVAGDAVAGNAVDGAALESGDPESAIYGDCYLKVDGKVVLDIRKDCPMVSLHDGQGSLILNSDGESEIKGIFAYLTPNGDGTAGASWNEEPGVTHAQAPLSEKLKRDGACWADERVRICATKR